jgi:predicted HAD superfamily Cof-like phosphohydrolase
MQEPQSLNSVSEFHKLFDAPILESPQIPNSDRYNLRISLIQEELNELKQAINDNSIVDVADALGDIQYVLSGAILEFGLGENFKEIFDEIQRSNLSKACLNIKEAEATVEYYKNERNTDSYIVERDGKYLVYRKEDNKVLKSINYSPANLERILKS